MRRLLDRIPYSFLILAAAALLAAPVRPRPHVLEKLEMLFSGALNRPLDIFDLVFHLAPSILLLIKWRLGRNPRNPRP
jgi:hypothetical protein